MLQKMFQNLHLHDFRSYTDQVFEFTSDQVVLLGPNGIGKTNVLEALYMLSTGKTWRAPRIANVIREGADSALLRATTEEDTYALTLTPRSRTLTRNEKKSSWTSHIDNLPTLLFAPEFSFLFQGPKANRHRFFDRILTQARPEALPLLQQSQKVLTQKQSLLREDHVDLAMLSALNALLADIMPKVWSARAWLAGTLSPYLQEKYSDISHTEEPVVLALAAAQNLVPKADAIAQMLDEMRPREIAARRCLVGSHRDDFVMLLREKPLPLTASRGEGRSVLLATLWAARMLLQQSTGRAPVLLLDDVFSELDANRQAHLRHLCTGAQVFFTTTHKTYLDGLERPQIIQL